ARAGEHDDPRSVVHRARQRGKQLLARLGVDGVAPLLAVDGENRSGAASLLVDHSMTAIRSPSCTWSFGATLTSVTVPEAGDSTGISIFIASRMAPVSPSAMVWPGST